MVYLQYSGGYLFHMVNYLVNVLTQFNIHKYILVVWLYVCLSPITDKTAVLIGPQFFVATLITQ